MCWFSKKLNDRETENGSEFPYTAVKKCRVNFPFLFHKTCQTIYVTAISVHWRNVHLCYYTPENAINVIYGLTTTFMNTSGISILWNQIAYSDDVWIFF